MLRISLKLLPISLLSLSVAAVAHGESLNLSQALQTAEKNSPRLQQAASVREEYYWKKVESRSAFLPVVTGTATYLTDYKYVYTDLNFGGADVSIPGIAPTTVYGLNGQLNVFDGFASTNRLRAASSFERAAERDLDWVKFTTDLEVTLQFYRALAAKTLRAVTEANLKTLEEHLQDANQLKRSGLSTNYDVLRVDVQVSEARSELMNSGDEIETANGRLAELLGSSDLIDPQGTLPELRPDLIDKMEASKTPRPDVDALMNRVQGLQQQKYAASVHWVPRVNIFGTYQYYNNRNDEYDDWNNFRNAYQIGVNLTWNLFEGFASEAKSREVLEQKVQAERSLRMAQLKASQDMAFWKRKYKYFYSVFKARQGDIGKAKESVRLAREGRRVGSRTSSELLDAETDLHRAQAGAIRAQLGVIEALVNLEMATGQKLYDFN